MDDPFSYNIFLEWNHYTINLTQLTHIVLFCKFQNKLLHYLVFRKESKADELACSIKYYK